MNVFDIVILIFMAMSGVVGFKKGAIKGAVNLVGMLAIFYIAYLSKGIVGNFLSINLPFFEMFGSFKDIDILNVFLYQLIGFLIVFAVLYSVFAIVLNVTGVIQKFIDHTIILTLPSKLIGILVGLLEGYLILFIVFLVASVPFENALIYQESEFVNKIIYETPVLSSSTENITNSTKEILNLADDINNETKNSTEISIEAADIMLKYDIVSAEVLEKVYEKDKLGEIPGLEAKINEYK